MLKLGEPAFLPLVGQTRLAEPERVLPEVLNRIRRVLDESERGRLLTALASLMNSEEALAMVEQMLDAAEESLLDTPYLRRIRQQGREEGWLEGLVRGKEEGVAEGIAKGKEAGVIEGLREAILEAITVRFDPAASEYRRVSRELARFNRREQLQSLLSVVLKAETMSDFAAHLTSQPADE